jgi:chitinase
MLISAFNTKDEATIPEIEYIDPIVITSGGTYSNLRIRNADSNISAIKIMTSQPVIIENSIIYSAGHCIQVGILGSNVTVRNTKGYGLLPSVDNKARGRFFHCSNFYNAVVENCYFEGTTGIYLLDYRGNHTLSHSIKVRYNKAKNIDGRDRKGGNAPGNYQFCQLDKCRNIIGVEISWNEVYNEYDNSLVEDIINIFLSFGAEEHPIEIHHNILDGAYPTPGQTGYAGGGIMCDARWEEDTQDCTKWVKAYNNHIIRTANYGLGIAGGNNNLYYDNRVIASNIGPNGEKIVGAGNNGIQVWNYPHPKHGQQPYYIFFNNTAVNNEVGYMHQTIKPARKDFYFRVNKNPVVNDCTNCIKINPEDPDINISLPNPIDKTLEDAEYDLWEIVKQANGITQIGPNF